MTKQAAREMTLKEWVDQLPAGHRAHREYDELMKPMILVKQSEPYTGPIQPGMILPVQEGEVASGFEWYEEAAMRTLSGPSGDSFDSMLNTAALGLTGEGGEVAELVKKYFYHGHPIDRVRFAKEFGDILWYVACGCRAIGIPMSMVASMNIAKLMDRYPEKFESERSLNKDESKEATSLLPEP